jgi:tripartite-type tricarboxylate transporter receptor subunit TctC
LAGAPLLSLTTGAAATRTWPDRPVKFIVPFGAGSGTDIVARLVGARLSGALRQPVVVENKVGASGAIAASSVARATPDGYTVFIATQTTQASNPGMFKKLPYDPIKDFEPVTMLGSIPLIVVINPSIPANSIQELVAWARANPGKLSCGFGTGAAQVTGELFKTLSKADILLVPYKSNPQALTAVVANEVGMMVTDPGPSLPLIDAGRVRALAITATRRSAIAPKLPTMAEAGMSGYELSAWYAALLPAATPASIRDRLHAELVKIMAMLDVRQQLRAAGIEAGTSSPQELSTFMTSELKKWATHIHNAGITPE